MLPEALSIRPAVSSDADRLIPHINAAFAAAEPFMSGPRTDPDRLADALRKGDILLAEDASGHLLASIYVEPRHPRGYAGMLAVSPDYQRSGIGRRMMQAAEDYLRARGCTALDITSSASAPSSRPSTAPTALSRPAPSPFTTRTRSRTASKLTASSCPKTSELPRPLLAHRFDVVSAPVHPSDATATTTLPSP